MDSKQLNIDALRARFESTLERLHLFRDESIMRAIYGPSLDTSRSSETWQLKYSYWKKIIMSCLDDHVFGESVLIFNKALLEEICVWRGLRFNQFEAVLKEMVEDGILEYPDPKDVSFLERLFALLNSFLAKRPSDFEVQDRRRIRNILRTIDVCWKEKKAFGSDNVVQRESILIELMQSFRLCRSDSEHILRLALEKGVFSECADWIIHTEKMAQNGYNRQVFEAVVRLKTLSQKNKECIESFGLSVDSRCQREFDSMIERSVILERMILDIDDLCQAREIEKATSLSVAALATINSTKIMQKIPITSRDEARLDPLYYNEEPTGAECLAKKEPERKIEETTRDAIAVSQIDIDAKEEINLCEAE